MDSKFFEGDKLTSWGQSLVDFSVQYEQDVIETRLFVNKLRDLKLLTTKHVGQTIDGEDRAYANFISIDGDVLKNLFQTLKALLLAKRFTPVPSMLKMH